MKDELISRAEVMKALTEEYNRRHTEQNGLQLAYIEKEVEQAWQRHLEEREALKNHKEEEEDI